MSKVKTIKTSEVVALLKKGYVRWRKDETVPNESVQAHFNLSFSECKALFNTRSLKGVRTAHSSLVIEDDLAGPATLTVSSVGHRDTHIFG